MSMNSIIRENRKALGFTQEQVADYLGVSTPAVNKWEKGASYPDVSLLSALARLLKIDLNTLLCFNEELTEQEISHFSKEIIAVIRKLGFDKGFTMGMEKVREYPNSEELIFTTAQLLSGALFMYGADIDNKENYESQITALYERVAKSNKEQVRNGVSFMLASKYIEKSDYEKAQKMLDNLPEDTLYDRSLLQANLYIKQEKLTEAAGLLEHKLLLSVNEIHVILMNLTNIALKEEKQEKASQLAMLSEKYSKMFELWDMNAYLIPLQVALAKKDVQNSILLIKSVLAAAISPWVIKDSILYSHISKKDEQQNSYGKQILPAILSELDTSSEYDFLHSESEFQRLLEQYRRRLCKE